MGCEVKRPGPPYTIIHACDCWFSRNKKNELNAWEVCDDHEGFDPLVRAPIETIEEAVPDWTALR